MGFKGLRSRIVFNTAEGEIPLDLEINAFIELGGERRGAHLSRNIDALAEAVLETGPSRSIESFLDKAAARLLEKHPYARRAVVEARTLYYVDLEWEGIRGKEPVGVSVMVSRDREGGRYWTVSVEVAGLSVCPSAMVETSRITGGESLSPSHVQRVIVRGKVTTRGVMVRIEDVARALAYSASAPAFTRLKRAEEARLVISAFKNPKLAEDIARDALCKLYGVVGGGNEAILEVEVESLESIHPHNVYAARRASTAELEAEAGEACA